MEDKTLKILMTTDTLGGVWNYSLELCKELQKYGVQVHLLSMGKWPTSSQELQVRNIKNIILYKSNYKLEWMGNSCEDTNKVTKWISTILKYVEPDIIHLNNFAQIDNYDNYPIVTVYHSCVQTWWKSVKGETAPSNWNNYKNLVSNALNISDVIVSPTHSLLKQVIDVHEIIGKTEIIYNGFERSNHLNKVNTETTKEKFILSCGRIWDQAKNMQVLSQLANKIPWPIYVAGDDVNPDTGEKMILPNINTLGKLTSEELSQWMQRASIFISPSFYEPFGLSALEAATHQCAIVLSDIDTFNEIWGTSALLFNVNHPRELEKAVLSLIHNRSYCQQMAKKAKERSKLYNASKMGNLYHRLYCELLSKKRISNPLIQAV